MTSSGTRIWFVACSDSAATEGGLYALAWTRLTDETDLPYNHSTFTAGTVTYQAQWFDPFMNLGPLGDQVTCLVTV